MTGKEVSLTHYFIEYLLISLVYAAIPSLRACCEQAAGHITDYWRAAHCQAGGGVVELST
jgi:hypothetical protein